MPASQTPPCSSHGNAPSCSREAHLPLLHRMKLSGKQKDLHGARALHAEIVQMGTLRTDLYLGSALISMYARCGMLASAQIVFDELPDRDIATWNALIGGYSQQGLGEKALDWFDQMKGHALLPNEVTFTCVLKACGSIGAIDRGEEIHKEITRQGLLKKNNVVLGNAIIDMYAKCGFLEKARRIFDELPVRDIISWNSLIAGYTQHRLDVEALECFREMENEGFSPDVVTFTCLLKACGSICLIEKGEEMHEIIQKRGLFENNIAIANALVDMYAKLGALSKAREVFDKILTKNVVSWNVLISGYVQQGFDGEALHCFRQMQGKGFIPDSVTFSCILKLYGSIGLIEEGEAIHAEIKKKDLLKNNVVLSNSLLEMYVDCGLLSKAQELFYELPIRNATSWNVMMAGYARHELNNETLNCFARMKDEGFFPSETTFTCVLKACGGLGSLQKGVEIHSLSSKQDSSDKGILLHTALINMYAKCGEIMRAQEVFDELPTRDAVAWTVLMNEYAQHCLEEKALVCFERMQDEGFYPDTTTFSCVLKACGSLRSLEKGEQIHAKIRKQKWLENDAVIGTTLIDMYVKCGSLEKAQKVLEELPVRDASSWNALISGYVQNDLCNEALGCFSKMQEEGSTPDAITVVCILKACGNIGSAEKAESVHMNLFKLGLLRATDTMVGTALVDMYIRCGSLSAACHIFDKLSVRDTVSWNVLITGYIQQGLSIEALDCFSQMQADGVSPDAATFSCIAKACGSVGLLNMGQSVHDEASKQKMLDKDVALSNSLVDMYAKCGALAKALEVFDELLSRDIVSWNVLIAGFAQLGEARKVFSLLKRMIVVEGVKPNVVTFVVALIACSHVGLVDEGETCFDAMKTIYCLTPTPEHYSCMVDLFSRSGRFDKAILVIDTVAPSTRPQLWSTLLAACQKMGNVELASSIFEHAVALEKDNSSLYVSMSNIYAASMQNPSTCP